MKKIHQVPLPSVEAIYYWIVSWGLYHLVRPVLQIVTDPFCNWVEEKQWLLYIPRYNLKKARLFLDIGRDPSRNEADLLFSAIQGGVWTLGLIYGIRYNHQRIKDLMAGGFLDEALNSVHDSKGAKDWRYPWKERKAAEIRALQAGYPLPPVIEPAEGPISWSIQKILIEEMPKWKNEDINYIIGELYLRWGYRMATDGRKRAVKPKIWNRVMGKIKERFPEAITLRWHNSCACQVFNYLHVELEPEEELELDTACKRKACQ